MSLEDLERAGVLLPRDEWGKRDLHTTVNKPLLGVTGATAAISALLMYFGGGGLFTWIGVGLYFVVLFGFTLVSLRAVEKQVSQSALDQSEHQNQEAQDADKK